MRNFEERKAEIFRRSEIKIKKQRAIRVKILIASISLCLCIAVLAVVNHNDFEMFNDMSNGGEDINSLLDPSAPSEFSYSGFQVTENTWSADVIIEQKDTDNIMKAYNLILSSFKKSEDVSAEQAVDKDTESQNNVITKDDAADFGVIVSSSANTTLSDKKGVAFIISFLTENGTRLEFTLDGKKLTDKASGKSVNLTDGEISDIKTALGLIETSKGETK